MANEQNLKKYKKGETGNPNGRPPDPPELKELKRMNKGELELLFHRILNAPPSDLSTFNGTILEKWVASIIFHGIKTGDYARLNPFLERLFGKVKDEITGDIGFKVIIEDYSKKND